VGGPLAEIREHRELLYFFICVVLGKKGPRKGRGVRGKARKDHSDRLTPCKGVSYSQAFSGKGTTVVVCMPTPNRAKGYSGLAST
jgi:hypothetical protein